MSEMQVPLIPVPPRVPPRASFVTGKEKTGDNEARKACLIYGRKRKTNSPVSRLVFLTRFGANYLWNYGFIRLSSLLSCHDSIGLDFVGKTLTKNLHKKPCTVRYAAIKERMQERTDNSSTTVLKLSFAVLLESSSSPVIRTEFRLFL